VKPARFDYYDPTSVDEVLALLQQYGDEAKLLAGGQSLIPILNMRLAKPAVLIDLNRVAGLAYIRELDSQLQIGALTRHAEVERSPLIATRQPLLAETVRQIGHSQIRNRGTIGGSLAHADPAAELPAVMVALDGTFCLRGPSGVREVPAGEFFLMYFTTCIRPDEILTEVRVPVLPPRTGYAFLELSRRHGDFALAGVACTLTLAADGTMADCRLGLTGVSMTPVRATAAEARLQEGRPEPGLFAEAAGLVRAAVAPESDVHGSAEYRRHLAGVLTERALATALQRASVLLETEQLETEGGREG
jgi:carbon-monoxide dehydrogenase medium subunit